MTSVPSTNRLSNSKIEVVFQEFGLYGYAANNT